jgi:glutamine amidotransferase
MQVLCDISEEFRHDCLGIIPGAVRRFPATLKVPQIGWNQYAIRPHTVSMPCLMVSRPDRFLFCAFVLSDVTNKSIVAGETDYTLEFPSVLINGNLAAAQFHPEKSGTAGLRLLRNFVQHMAQLRLRATACLSSIPPSTSTKALCA